MCVPASCCELSVEHHLTLLLLLTTIITTATANTEQIAQEATMRLNKNVWVDGSLRDAEWYDRVFKQIRSQHPHYSIAIIYVYASAETVFARARKRGEETGRFVAEEEILDSMRRYSFQTLYTAYTHYVVLVLHGFRQCCFE
jgi:Zeta toxin